MKYIFITGAPGSKWSRVAKSIYFSSDIDHTDYNDNRVYYNKENEIMHFGSYYDPEMEFGTFFDKIESYSKQDCENEFDEGYVEKNGYREDFVGSLIYGAIFADRQIYECNVKRLLYRTGRIAEVFLKQTDLILQNGCNTNLRGDLTLMSNLSNSDLLSLNLIAKDIKTKNKIGGVCSLW